MASIFCRELSLEILRERLLLCYTRLKHEQPHRLTRSTSW